MDAHDLPLLGESLPLELANTRYGDPDDAGARIDFLARPESARAWLVHVHGLSARPPHLDDADHRALVELRDAVAELLAAPHPAPPPPTVIATLNAAAQRGRVHQRLGWGPEGPCIERVACGAPMDEVIRQLADATFAWLCGPDRARTRRCAAPDCWMWFVAHHRRRRFCHPTCSGRDRQTRFRQRSS